MNQENIFLSEIKDIEVIEKKFIQKLLKWNKKDNKRQMPWKGEKDPYKIWLSEIILQQTRVEQGLKYYENFVRTFPDVNALAKAPEEKIFKLWEGLGYYSRCRNLITTAKYIAINRKGVFPKDFESIFHLKGVGSYTAAAIASFAYNLPYAVLDGNVFRVLSRIADIETPIDTTEGKKQFAALAQYFLPKTKAGEYNQALMDFGATVCKPVPECSICFFNKHCKAFIQDKQLALPVKEKALKVKERWFNYFILRYKNQVLIHQRLSKDIWQQLFEFLLVETDKKITPKKLLKQFQNAYGIDDFKLIAMETTHQRLSHQFICFNFITLELNKKPLLEGYKWIPTSLLDHYAFPKTLKDFANRRL